MISIIIPTYNREDTLLIAINSVFKQTYTNFEILICDDGSTDSTLILLNSINDSRLRIIKCEHSGKPAFVRNQGIKNSNGEWIAFLDSDDYWAENKLEKQLYYANKFKSLAISTNAFRINNSKSSLYFSEKKNTILNYYSFLEQNKIICSSVLIHRSLINKIGYFPEDFNLRGIEDYAYWIRVTNFTNWLYLEEGLVFYLENSIDSIRKKTLQTFSEQRKIVLKNYFTWSNISIVNFKFLFTRLYIIIVKFYFNKTPQYLFKKIFN